MWTDDGTALDVLNAVRNVCAFSAGMNRAQFNQDLKTQSAVLHQIILLGEAVKRLSPEFREKHSSIPWTQIAGMRDRCIHGYDNVDLDRVWEVIQTHAPTLISYLSKVVPEPPQ